MEKETFEMIRSYYNKKLPDMTREQFKANMCGYLNCMIELDKIDYMEYAKIVRHISTRKKLTVRAMK
uniref:Uncharacterized protein n=1 Tax=Podoviridae sp. ctza028 TaxID=2825289 RepID=A0A8S5Q443_9CAUD|nr:MAG TPA: hypothetical protein [Podoviridae sp. ctza028]